MRRELKKKIEIAENNIIEWYEYFDGKVAVAYSGGKDSTAMLHLVRSIYPEVEGVFVNTGLEFPELVLHVKKQDNIRILRPKIPFHKIIDKYGYPVVSKTVAQKIYEIRHAKSRYSRQRKLSGSIGMSLPKKYRYLIGAPFKISDKCCNFMKKEPMRRYRKETGNKMYLGLLASDSRARSQSHFKHGCNAFNRHGDPQSRPIMSWTSDIVWEYIRENNLEYPSVYDMGMHQTGCMFCGFGSNFMKSPNRFQRMKETHPRQWKYIIYKLKMGEVLDYMSIPYE